jgi:hypothetical protein
MIRSLSLTLLIVGLGACAATPQSETDSLVHDVVTNRSAPLQCVERTYCVTNGSRIAANREETCTCAPPPAMQGIPLGR